MTLKYAYPVIRADKEETNKSLKGIATQIEANKEEMNKALKEI